MPTKLDYALQKLATGDGGEALAQIRRVVLTREDTRKATHALFDNAEAAQKRDRSVVEKLFLQTPAAQTMAPNLQKTAAPTTPKNDKERRHQYGRIGGALGAGKMLAEHGKGIVDVASDQLADSVSKAVRARDVPFPKGKWANRLAKAKLVGKAAIKPGAKALGKAGLVAGAGAGAGYGAGRAVHRVVHGKANLSDKKKSKTASVDSFFDQLDIPRTTEAQRRYPELLKVASSRHNGDGA